MEMPTLRGCLLCEDAYCTDRLTCRHLAQCLLFDEQVAMQCYVHDDGNCLLSVVNADTVSAVLPINSQLSAVVVVGRPGYSIVDSRTVRL